MQPQISSNYDFNNISFDFSKILLEYYNKKYNTNISSLEKLHEILDIFTSEEREELVKIKLFGINDRKSVLLLDFYQLIDNDPIFIQLYNDFIQQVIKKVHYPKETYILFQTTPNLRISFPGSTSIGARPDYDPEGIVGLHTDGEFGHLDEEMNFIIPLTEMFDTNSVYYEKEIGSNIAYEDYSIVTLSKDQYFMGKLNKLKHYNKINSTGQTRVSLDIRVIPYSEYKENDVCSISLQKKFVVGEYYSMA